MPRAVPVTYADFLKIEAELTSKRMRFVEIDRQEVATIIVAHGLVPPRKIIRPGEIGFRYTENGYTIKVWTSCLRRVVEQCRAEPLLSQNVTVGRPTSKDAGWIVVVDSTDQSQYFARKTHRTKGFVETLLRRVWITQFKVRNRPLCKTCGKFMKIFVQDDGGTFWACFRKGLHDDGNPRWEDWDCGLPPRARRYAKAWRKPAERNRKKVKISTGQKPRRACTIRKGWRAAKNPY